MYESRLLKLTEIPTRVFDDIRDDIIRYSVALITHGGSDEFDDHLPIGSGVLVCSGGKFGLLNAKHVAESVRFKCATELGLVLKGTPHRYAIPMSELNIKCLCDNSNIADTPGLAVVRLPDSRLGYVHSNKGFWPLDRPPKQQADLAITEDKCWWCIAGFPQVAVEEHDGIAPFDQLARTGIYFAFCSKERGYSLEQMEYGEFLVSYAGGIGDCPPASFGGFSGGGLWKVSFVSNSPGQIDPIGPHLAGIVFAESSLSGGSKLLTCHLEQSVMVEACELLEGM